MDKTIKHCWEKVFHMATQQENIKETKSYFQERCSNKLEIRPHWENNVIRHLSRAGAFEKGLGIEMSNNHDNFLIV